MEGNEKNTATYSEIRKFIDDRLDKIENTSPAQPFWRRCLERLGCRFNKKSEKGRKIHH